MAEGQKIPTLFEWKSKANEVYLVGSWDLNLMTRLEKHSEYSHSVVHSLEPGQYKFRYLVDGTYTWAPYLSTVTAADGTKYNILSIDSQNWIPTLFEWRSSAIEVYVVGSWDWDQNIRLQKHGQDRHCAVHSLEPGQYMFCYFVDGRRTCAPNLSTIRAGDGMNYNIISVDKSNGVPTFVHWGHSAKEVVVYGSWDMYQGTRLHNCGDHHYTWLLLQPDDYWFHFGVDGVDMHDPYLSWQVHSDGRKYNFISVKMPLTKPELNKDCMVSITLSRKCEYVDIMGSWDSWKKRLVLSKSGNDYHRLLRLHPGVYYLKFFVDGEEILKEGMKFVVDDRSVPVANKVAAILPERHCLRGVSSSAFVDDLISMTKKKLAVDVKFKVVTYLGSIDRNAKIYPCTDFGYMLLGFLSFVKETYRSGHSWGGCFGPKDMAIIDGKHCQIKAEAKLPLTRAHVILDSLQLREHLLSRFQIDGKYPPYFESMFSFMENPPDDFDSNCTSKAIFLDLYDNQAAAATPPRRMLVLVNMSQFFKQLPGEKEISKFEDEFHLLVEVYESWQQTVHEDTLLNAIYRHRRQDIDENEEAVRNTSLRMTNFLRVFFVHGPDHTVVDKIQMLEAFAELDLIIAYYYDQLFHELIKLIREKMDQHVLIRAIWDFYCGGSPPDHYQMPQVSSAESTQLQPTTF